MVGEAGIRRGWASIGLAHQPTLHVPNQIETKRVKCKKGFSFLRSLFLNVVGEEGFEPPTLWSQTRCATKLRYSPK